MTRVFQALTIAGLAVLAAGSFGFSSKAARDHARPLPMATSTPLEARDHGTVWVMRSEGEQCSVEANAKSLDAGMTELEDAGIHVLESRKSDDGKMHAQVCGAPSGRENAYRISRADLPKALEKGFHE